jgi:hypothetical protein
MRVPLVIGLAAATLGLATAPARAIDSGTQVALGAALSPDASVSTSGDFATDAFSNPWDFSDEEDVIPVPGVGVFYSDSASVANGLLNVATRDAAGIRLLMNWSKTQPILPWGHDGWVHPIDADTYTQLDFRIKTDQATNISVRWWAANGSSGVMPMMDPTNTIAVPLMPGDFQTIHFDMKNPKNYPFPSDAAPWTGKIVWLEIFRAPVAGNPVINLSLDWVRLHRADAPAEPTPAVALPQVISPNIVGGADYATTVLGNPWDFHGLDDVKDKNDVANLAIDGNGDLTGVATGNDPFIEVPLGPTLNTDRFHHISIDICYGGVFGLDDVPGGGMVGRVNWIPHGAPTWVSGQAFIVFPGCHTISFDMATNPPQSLNDPSTEPTGWRGMRIDRLRFDLEEDRGARPFTLRNISLTDDSAFSSTAPIVFQDASVGGGPSTADIFATTVQGDYAGTQIASGIKVQPGVNTFTWDGKDVNGNLMPNATYWIYIVMKNRAGVGTGYSTGTLRLETPVPSAPSYYVPLTPARLLDTRTGEGGNLTALAEDTFTELQVLGVGGVPYANVTAVVMNVTVTDPTASGYITAWPSGEPRPLVSNLNFVPGQTVPNLVTVKVGANGRVNLYNSAGFSDLIADVAGYYTTAAPRSGGKFTALTPNRLLDTRDGTGTGGAAGPLGQGQHLDLHVVGVGGVPATGVSGVALNVTVDQPTATGYVTVWPTGEPMPNASTHNYTPGLTVANLVLAKVGAGGSVSIYNNAGQTHVIADVIGYFSSDGGLFVPVSPQRVIDSRDGTGGPTGPLQQGETRSLTIATGSPVPGNATAMVGNVTSVDTTVPGYVTVWPSGSAMPLASTLNPRPGVAVPNQAYLRLGGGGKLDVFNSAGINNVIVDVFGYITS